MALVTLFIRGGHAGDAGVELDCTCGCEDVCAPAPIEPTEDITPFDDLTSEPTPADTCGADVTPIPDVLDVAPATEDPDTSEPTPSPICTTDADCAGDVEGAECHDGDCYCPTGVACTEDAECTGDFTDAYCHGDGVCMAPCREVG